MIRLAQLPDRLSHGLSVRLRSVQRLLRLAQVLLGAVDSALPVDGPAGPRRTGGRFLLREQHLLELGTGLLQIPLGGPLSGRQRRCGPATELMLDMEQVRAVVDT